MSENPFLKAALFYAELGYRVFPCIKGRKEPLTENGFRDATTDEDMIRVWWQQNPDANLAIATVGLLVVDVDRSDGSWPEDRDQYFDLNSVPRVSTPRGGSHYYFRQPEGKNYRCTTGKLAERVDTRADGGYVLVPPSKTEHGIYIEDEFSPVDEEPRNLPDPPDWIIEMLEPAEETEDVRELSADSQGNVIPEGQRNSALARMSGILRRFGSTESEILAFISEANLNRCRPPLSVEEVREIARSISRYKPDEVSVAVAENHFGQDFLFSDKKKKNRPKRKNFNELLGENLEMKPPLIHGLLRIGEIMNVISSPKVGKSWLVIDLALSIIRGEKWLGSYQIEKGRVLVIDNELHEETMVNRYKKVCEAKSIEPGEIAGNLDFWSYRGHLEDLVSLSEGMLGEIKKDEYQMIIIDAWYRVLPQGTDENDNGGIARLYNTLDTLARVLNTAMVVIHHSSKGNQSLKDVTDVGAGAGSQSRAADSHLVLRKHQMEDFIVLEGVTRTWPKVSPICIGWSYPVFFLAEYLDPSELLGAEKKKGEQKRKEPEMSTEDFVLKYLESKPLHEILVIEKAEHDRLTERQARKFIKKAIAKNMVYKWKSEVGILLSVEPQSVARPKKPSKKKAVMNAIKESPDLSNREISEKVNCSERYVRGVRKSF